MFDSQYNEGKEEDKDQESIHTHYYNSNLLWRTVSRRVDEVIPSDHTRRKASRVIQWYGLSTRRDTVRQIKLLL